MDGFAYFITTFANSSFPKRVGHGLNRDSNPNREIEDHFITCSTKDVSKITPCTCFTYYSSEPDRCDKVDSKMHVPIPLTTSMKSGVNHSWHGLVSIMIIWARSGFLGEAQNPQQAFQTRLNGVKVTDQNVCYLLLGDFGQDFETER